MVWIFLNQISTKEWKSTDSMDKSNIKEGLDTRKIWLHMQWIFQTWMLQWEAWKKEWWISAWCSSKYFHKLSILHEIIWKIYQEIAKEKHNWTAHQEYKAQPFKSKESHWSRPFIHHRSNGANWCIKGNVNSAKWNEDS